MGLRIDQTSPGINKVIGGDGIAVRPARRIAQLKDIALLILTLPGGGDAGLDAAVRPLINQPLKQIAQHLRLRQSDGGDGIQRYWLILQMAYHALRLRQNGARRHLRRQGAVTDDDPNGRRGSRRKSCIVHYPVLVTQPQGRPVGAMPLLCLKRAFITTFNYCRAGPPRRETKI